MEGCKLRLILLNFFVVILLSIRVTKGIVGGNVIEQSMFDEFKYTVSIQGTNGHVCSGAVVHPRYAMSAAHCLFDANGNIILDHFHIIGGINRIHNSNSARIMYPIIIAYVPKQFKRIDPKIGVREKADISLLKSKDRINVGDSANYPIKLVKLPLLPINHRYRRYRSEKVIVTGFGLESPPRSGEKRSRNELDVCFRCDKLKKAEGSILDVRACESMYLQKNIFEEHICAKVDQGNGIAGICRGDNGAPLMHFEDKTLIGIMGRVYEHCNDGKFAGIYTRVTSYMPFINSILKNEKSIDVFMIDYNKLLTEKYNEFRNAGSSSGSG